MIKKNGKLVEVINCEKLFVVGDIHGDLSVFQEIVKIVNEEWKKSSDVLLLFLGDYADRGDYGLEVIEGLKELIEKHPTKVVALKGNHEDYDENGNPKFRPSDLIHEVVSKRGTWHEYFKRNLSQFFSSLPIAAKYRSILFVHGGISSKVKSLEDLMFPSKEIEEDILWSDPFEGYGEYPNPRGAGVLFGKDITDKVLSLLSANKLIRAHQPQKAINGVFEEHGGKVVTISSTRVYNGKAALLEIHGNVIKVRHIL
jgi:protein phosphatase